MGGISYLIVKLSLGLNNSTENLNSLVTSVRSNSASPEDTVSSLMTVEAKREATRIAGDAAYSVGRHIEVLIAILAEAQLLRRGGIA